MSKGLVLIGLTLAGTAVSGEGPAPERALARSAQDVQVQWGPCPAFMPPGCGLSVLHGDPTKENADVFLKLPAGAAIPDHWHTSAERMLLAAGELHVTYQGQEKVVLRPGMYAYGPARLPHSASCAGTAACVLFIAFEAAVDAIPTAAPRR
jgi:quercetin dioxygenase-like cupin family protein